MTALTSPPPRGSKLHVFLSYRSVEARFADVLKQALVRDFIGLVDVFLASDTTSIPAGESWHSEIIEALQRAELHIVLCSRSSVRCPWIHYEAGGAAVRSIPIVPLCHSGLLPHQLPVPLSESEGGVITDQRSLEKLYGRIASIIGSAIPDADLRLLAQRFGELEQQLKDLIGNEAFSESASSRGTESEPELIQDPHVVCVTSQQFDELGYANQLDIVRNAFPRGLRHQFVRSSSELRRILVNESVDIVHIAAFVCPRGGDLYFTPIDLQTGASAVDEADMVSPEGLVSLIRQANTRLVVLGASASLVLGAQLLTVTNVIAVRDMVSAKAMASWVETFYQTLMKKSLADAFQLATQVSQAPMSLYAQQRHIPDFNVRLTTANSVAN